MTPIMCFLTAPASGGVYLLDRSQIWSTQEKNKDRRHGGFHVEQQKKNIFPMKYTYKSFSLSNQEKFYYFSAALIKMAAKYIYIYLYHL